MSKFQSTKILELGSCAFRQPHASHSHCRFIHGYKLSAKFWFEAKELDENNWVVDFGGMGDFKKILRDQFDHTTCIAADDPASDIFQKLAEADACDLRIMPDGTGVERIAEWCYKAANRFIAGQTNNRCQCVKVEVFEHENNSAVYTSEIAPSKDLTRPPFAKQELKLDMGEPYADARKSSEPLPDPPPEITIEVTNSEGEVKEEVQQPPEEQHGLGPGQTKTSGSWVDPKYKGKTKNSWLF
jgi:6-pyruvoyltetrahydropterin/6-carboxytetrahydropterin synthase